MRFASFEHMLSYYAAQIPDAPALCFESGGGLCRCSYAELLDAVRRRAAELKGSGKSCIGILSDGSFECVVTIFAANMAGLQVVMLDASLPEAALAQLIGLTDIDLLWGDDELKVALSLALKEGVKDGADKMLFFTSGTTSMSKAVVLTGHSLCQSAYNGASKLTLTPDNTLMCMLPLAHVFGFVCSLLWGLSCGATVALGRGRRHYADDLVFFRPTALAAVPSLLGFLMKQRLVNKELALVLVGAGDCPRELLDAAAAIGLRVSFGYGLTETSSGVAISVGGDPFAMEICPDDTVTLAPDGEILIEAPTCMMQGYYKRPDSTAEVLRGGVLSTGDLGYFDGDGRLHVTGRKKEILVLTDGTKIFLPEYETAVRSALGDTDIAVALKSSRPCLVYYGEDEADALRERLRPLMESYPRSQQLAEIIKSAAPLPRTAAGKLKRWAIDALIKEHES